MKVLVKDYTFDASEKTVTFDDYSAIVLERVLVITNVTDQVIIYNFADSALGGTAATNVLTLEYDTTSMADADKLAIWYQDDIAAPFTSLMTTELNALADGAGADAGSAWDNRDQGWQFGDFELLVGTGSAMTAGETFDLYLLVAPDGTNYCDDQENAFAGSFICEAATSGRYVLRNVPLPYMLIKARIVNNSGVALSATGNTLKVLPYRGA